MSLDFLMIAVRVAAIDGHTEWSDLTDDQQSRYHDEVCRVFLAIDELKQETAPSYRSYEVNSPLLYVVGD